MKIQYKIYEISTANVDPEQYQESYDPLTVIFPTVLRKVYQRSIMSEDTFDSLLEAETYLENNLIKEYGDTYTIVKEYSYED